MAKILDGVSKYLGWATPVINWIILVILPIYILFGEVLYFIAELFLGILPTESYFVAWFLMGTFIVAGIILGIMAEMKEREKNKNH